MKTLRKIDNFIIKIEKFFLSSSMILAALILFGNVIARRVFQSSWSWSEEVGQLMVVIMTFMGIGYGARIGEHINMSAFTDLAPHKGKKVLSLVISFITMVTMFIFAYLSLKYTLRVVASGRVSPALETPRYITTLFMPIGFTLGGIQYLINFLLNIKHKDKVYFNNISPVSDLYENQVIENQLGDNEEDDVDITLEKADDKVIVDKDNRR